MAEARRLKKKNNPGSKVIRPQSIGAHDQSVCSLKVGVQNSFLWDHVGSKFTKTVGKFEKKACFSNWSLKTYRRTRFRENVCLSQIQQLLVKSPEKYAAGSSISLLKPDSLPAVQLKDCLNSRPLEGCLQAEARFWFFISFSRMSEAFWRSFELH